MIVVDASVLVTALADDGPDGDRCRDRIVGQDLAAPDLVDLEVVSAWRRLHAVGRLPARRAQLALDDLTALRVVRAPSLALLGRCWELHDNLTVYDAAYVALAERFGCTLVTADGRMAGAPGIDCDVELLGWK